jgi:hypothetical protein
MARTIADIYAEIAAAKDSQAALAELAPDADTAQELMTALTSSSRVAIWRLWAYVTAVAIHTHEVLWDLYRAEVEKRAAEAIVGTLRWYQATVLAFQLGDALTYNSATGKYVYSVLDVTKQIVKRCAVRETAQGLVFKVAKLSGLVPVGLSLQEAQAVAGYIKAVRFAGTRFQVVSGAGDILIVTATVFYDPIEPLATLKAAVESAIKAYVANLPFDGELLVNRLIDAVQAVQGVRDFQVVSVSTKQSVAAPIIVVNRAHVPYYGYYVNSSASGETLADTITYTPQ